MSPKISRSSWARFESSNKQKNKQIQANISKFYKQKKFFEWPNLNIQVDVI